MTTPKTACGVSRINPNANYDGSGALVAPSPTPITLNNGAWHVIDWSPIRNRTFRGDPLEVPGLDNAVPMPLYENYREVSLNMVFGGDVDHLGASHAPLNVMQGLETNRAFFEAAAVTPPATTDNLFAFEFTDVLGVVHAGDLQTVSFDYNFPGISGYGVAVWRVRFPNGLS